MTMLVAGGLYTAHDSGPVVGSPNYVTLVILHGFVWHSGSFSKLIPISKDYNARLVLVHRRDYPGSAPLTDEELVSLQVPAEKLDETEGAAAKQRVDEYMLRRAHEVHDFLEDLVGRGGVMPLQPDGAGGLVLVGWSLAAIWTNAFLAYTSTYPSNCVKLPQYLKRVVCYDPAYHIIGYPPIPDSYNPFFDSTLSEEEKENVFNAWITGYFSHGDTLETLVRRTPLEHPRPTIESFTPEDIVSMTHPPPGGPQGSDSLLLHGGIRTGVFDANRKAALFLTGAEGGDSPTSPSSAWRNVELRYVYCAQSLWESTYGIWLLRSELAVAKAKGVPTRNVQIVRILQGNHFAHWDHPNSTMKAFVESDIVEV
ncbi:hypothetical protein C8Q80DRAFT_1274452 [Daedaleopsis nitida]|nr:hypothetical protein C8Q80DRAFT_1274452 [Daedaleopsis nitida]